MSRKVAPRPDLPLLQPWNRRIDRQTGVGEASIGNKAGKVGVLPRVNPPSTPSPRPQHHNFL